MKKLFKAIRQNNLEAIKDILEKKPEVVKCMATPPPKKDEGQSPLQVAVKVGNLTIAQYLIDKGADVNYMELDNGLSALGCYRCPVLIDAIKGLFFMWEEKREDYMQLIWRLLELGANPNKTDNRGNNSWDVAVNMYGDFIKTIKETKNQKIFTEMTKELLDVLMKYNIDILNLDRITKDLSLFKSYSLFLQNLILNRDGLFGCDEKEIENWNERWSLIASVIKPYYEKNNPYYQNMG